MTLGFIVRTETESCLSGRMHLPTSPLSAPCSIAHPARGSGQAIWRLLALLQQILKAALPEKTGDAHDFADSTWQLLHPLPALKRQPVILPEVPSSFGTQKPPLGLAQRRLSTLLPRLCPPRLTTHYRPAVKDWWVRRGRVSLSRRAYHCGSIEAESSALKPALLGRVDIYLSQSRAAAIVTTAK